jgi:hypothetical protein
MNAIPVGPGARRRRGAATTQAPEGMMNHGNRVMRRPWRAGPLPHHRRRRGPTDGLQRQRIVGRFRRATERGRVSALQAGRLLPLHALAWRAGLARPIQQPKQHEVRSRPSGSAAIRGQQFPLQCGWILPAPAPGRRNDQFPAAMMPQILRHAERFSRCMRSDGVPIWADRLPTARGQPRFNLPGSINPDSPQVNTAVNECLHLLPTQLHGNIP